MQNKLRYAVVPIRSVVKVSMTDLVITLFLFHALNPNYQNER
jgi:hypothetical protein